MGLLEPLQQALLTLESDLHQGGWDQPNMLYVVEMIERDDPYFVKVLSFDADPCEVLSQLPTLNKPRVKGVVLVSEVWMIDVLSSTDVRARLEHLDPSSESWERVLHEITTEALSKITPSQHPDRIEMRLVQCVMKNDTTLIVGRKRDEKPAILGGPGGQELMAVGTIIDGLRRIAGVT